MSDKDYDVPAEWAKRAWVNAAKYEEMYKQSVTRSRRLLGRAREAHRLVQAILQGQEHLVRRQERLDQMVRGRRHQCRLQLHRSASPQAREPDGDHLGRRRSLEVRPHHLCRACAPGGTFRQRAESSRRQERRSGHDLPTDDTGGGLRDARLCAHWRHPFGRVRRLLARGDRRPDRGRQIRRRHHCGRGSSRRPQGSAQGERRRGDRESGRRQDRHRCQAHG